MKRITTVLCAALVLVMTAFGTAHASGLEIVDISPADGSKGYQPANMAVKISFSENMMDEAAIASNTDKFSISDAEGKQQPFDIVYNADKYPDELWLVLKENLAENSEYTVKIEPGVVSASGSVLSEGMTTTFRTRSVKIDNLISMGLMGVLMAVMFFASSRAAKKAQEKEDPRAAEKAAEDSLNPYRLAKEKGISLTEAQAIVAKEREKLDRKREKAEAERAKREERKAEQRRLMEDEFESREKEYLREEGIYRVKGPRSVTAAGGRIPRSVRRRNEAKRKAAAEKARNAQKNKKKK